MKIQNVFFICLAFLSFLNCDSKKTEISASESTEVIDVVKNAAPNFVLNDIHGKTVKLADFKGSYVYMDIWATWCGPCKVQIPFMQEIEEKYHEENIKFVSVSIDAEKDKLKWQNFVDLNQMGGIQLFAGKKTPFSNDYEVSSIPKFVLIGKNGEIINENAPRPMGIVQNENGENATGLNPELIKTFDELLFTVKS